MSGWLLVELVQVTRDQHVLEQGGECPEFRTRAGVVGLMSVDVKITSEIFNGSTTGSKKTIRNVHLEL